MAVGTGGHAAATVLPFEAMAVRSRPASQQSLQGRGVWRRRGVAVAGSAVALALAACLIVAGGGGGGGEGEGGGRSELLNWYATGGSLRPVASARGGLMQMSHGGYLAEDPMEGGYAIMDSPMGIVRQQVAQKRLMASSPLSLAAPLPGQISLVAPQPAQQVVMHPAVVAQQPQAMLMPGVSGGELARLPDGELVVLEGGAVPQPRPVPAATMVGGLPVLPRVPPLVRPTAAAPVRQGVPLGTVVQQPLYYGGGFGGPVMMRSVPAMVSVTYRTVQGTPAPTPVPAAPVEGPPKGEKRVEREMEREKAEEEKDYSRMYDRIDEIEKHIEGEVEEKKKAATVQDVDSYLEPLEEAKDDLAKESAIRTLPVPDDEPPAPPAPPAQPAPAAPAPAPAPYAPAPAPYAPAPAVAPAMQYEAPKATLAQADFTKHFPDPVPGQKLTGTWRYSSNGQDLPADPSYLLSAHAY